MREVEECGMPGNAGGRGGLERYSERTEEDDDDLSELDLDLGGLKKIQEMRSKVRSAESIEQSIFLRHKSKQERQDLSPMPSPLVVSTSGLGAEDGGVSEEEDGEEDDPFAHGFDDFDDATTLASEVRCPATLNPELQNSKILNPTSRPKSLNPSLLPKVCTIAFLHSPPRSPCVRKRMF